MSAKVTKAVIAAAGFGTRFLPQTKAMPKEMLPLVDKPIIQYIVEQLVEAGIKDIIIVGSSSKRSIEDHFDIPNEDLLVNLRVGGPKKKPLIDEIEAISSLANFVYVRQKGPYGTATPLLNVAHLIGDEPFIYSFADDVSLAKPNIFEQMIALHEEFGGGILPCVKLTQDIEYERYGVVGGTEVRDGVIKMDKIIEKPGAKAAPSNLGSVGGYLLTSEALDYLQRGVDSLSGDTEFYLSDSVLEPMLRDGKDFYGCEIKNSRRYDTGNKLDYIKTVIDFALERDELRDDLLEHMRQKLS